MLPDPAGAVDDWCRLVADTNAERSEPGPITDRANQTGRTTRGRICVAGLVRLATPPTGDGDRDRPGSPVDLLDNRALVAHRRVHDRCSDATTTRHVAGFVWVTAGTVGPETTDAESDRREPNGSAGPVDEA